MLTGAGHRHKYGCGDITHKYFISLFLLVCKEFLSRFYNSLIARGVNFSVDTIEKELISLCLDVKGKENRLVWSIRTFRFSCARRKLPTISFLIWNVMPSCFDASLKHDRCRKQAESILCGNGVDVSSSRICLVSFGFQNKPQATKSVTS